MIGRPKRSKDEEKFVEKAREHIRRFKVSVIVLLLIREKFKDGTRTAQLPELGLHSASRKLSIKNVIKKCIEEYQTDPGINQKTTEFQEHTSELDLLYFFKKVAEKVGELTWAECEYIFLEYLHANNEYCKQLGDFFQKSCRPFFRQVIKKFTTKDISVCEQLEFKLDYKQWLNKRDEGQLKVEEQLKVEGQLKVAIFHLLIQILGLLKIKTVL